MDVIARARDVEIHAGRGWEFSFFASPYIAHREFAAVDIYQGRDFGDTALSPVAGKVFKTMKFESPSLGKSLPEYLILIGTGDYLVRIMHVEPSVRKGEEIHIGDDIGRFITNGYFFSWVDAGMHVEVRDRDDYLRARGGYELIPALKNKVTAEKPVPEMKGTVMGASKRNITVRLNRKNVVRINDMYALMDCITSLDYGGVLGRFNPGDEIYFNEIKIGKINRVGSHMSTFKTEKLRISVDDAEFAGISFMLGSDVVRLLPLKYGDPTLKKGGEIRIKIEQQVK
jgi:hypothetical protein